MKIGFSMLLQNYPAAGTLDYGDCSSFQVVCPICYEAVFKGVRRKGVTATESAAATAEQTHYLAHYQKDARTAECELRVQAMPQAAIVEKNQIARDQNLRYFISVLKNAALKSFFDKMIGAVSLPPSSSSSSSSLNLRSPRQTLLRIKLERIRLGAVDHMISRLLMRKIYLETTNDARTEIKQKALVADQHDPESIWTLRKVVQMLEQFEEIKESIEKMIEVEQQFANQLNDLLLRSSEATRSQKERFFTLRKRRPVRLLAETAAGAFKDFAVTQTNQTPEAMEQKLIEAQDVTHQTAALSPWHQWCRQVIESLRNGTELAERIQDTETVYTDISAESASIELPAEPVAAATRRPRKSKLSFDELLKIPTADLLAEIEAAGEGFGQDCAVHETFQEIFISTTTADLLYHLLHTSTGIETRDNVFLSTLILIEQSIALLIDAFYEDKEVLTAPRIMARAGRSAAGVAADQNLVKQTVRGRVTGFEIDVYERILRHHREFLKGLPDNDSFWIDLEQMTPAEPELIGEIHGFAGKVARNGKEMYLFFIWRLAFRILADIDYPQLLKEQRQAKAEQSAALNKGGGSFAGSFKHGKNKKR